MFGRRATVISQFLLAVLVTGGGCTPSSSPDAVSDSSSSKRSAPAVNPTPTIVDIGEAETWDIIRMSGKPIGYQVTRWQTKSENGEPVLEISAESQLRLLRFGQPTEESMVLVSRETPTGELSSFSTRVSAGGNPMVTNGKQFPGKLQISTEAGGSRQSWELPLAQPCEGLFAVETSLKRQPMKSGEVRKLQAFVPILNVVASVELVAMDWEETPLFSDTKRLLRIQGKTTLAPGQQIQTDLWTDAEGHVLRSYSPTMQQETIRVDKEIALGQRPANLDLGAASIVEIEAPLPSPAKTTRVKYRARLASENPALVFARRPYQKVEPIDERSAYITVTAVNPERLLVEESGPQDSDLQPSALIQADDPSIVALAAGLPDADDPSEQALAIATFAHQFIDEKNFSTTFASAADVAQSRTGDCTEHAVLVAALCRARGIPARVVVGLVYVPSKNGFGFHMWNEAWTDKGWLPLDATLSDGRVAGGHLVLSTSALSSQDSFSSFFPVIQTLGQLELKVEDFELSE